MPSESLWESLSSTASTGGRLHGIRHTIPLADLARATSLDGRLEELRGRSVLLLTRDQLTAALAMIELDGVARRMVLCPPDLAPEHVPSVMRDAEADACIIDEASANSQPGIPLRVRAMPELTLMERPRQRSSDTEWVLLTSGTTGVPKLLLHTLASLTSALTGRTRTAVEPLVWSTFYDIRRYGGLQVFLRGVHAGSLVLSDPSETTGDFIFRAGSAGVTHISGTPSHWRRALMSGATAGIAPGYVRLSGEIADQAILDSLHAAYPAAVIAHAFASTEAGVAFEVRDGKAGFPAALVDSPGAVELRVRDETLQIRSAGTARRYLGHGAEPLRTEDGFVDTGDRVEKRAGRYYFMGRRGGVINVGGLKVHPEEVEAVINTHPWVRMSLVRSRRNPITGAVVTAEVVVNDNAAGSGAPPPAEVLTRELTDRCRRSLAPHKVPAMIRIVPALEVSPSGKLVRPLA
ncbi:MAG TPA: class I adenylate-forming enzyme family protein [Steroidobacteraceae bacterium]|nr:class I adenylate-forming enzyme family protein [Steroidobacteraceae bacterium]